MCTETFLRLPAEKRNRFLDAAWDEFTAVPYAEASINKIIQRAGIPRGSFYQYFTDKSDLFSYLLENMCKSFSMGYGELLSQTRGDIFTMQLSAYDRFRQWNEETDLLRERCVRLLYINKGIDWKRLLPGWPPRPNSEFMEQIDISRFQRREPEFIWRVFSMAALNLSSAVMESLMHPERSEEIRTELAERLAIIKRGSLRADCLDA